MSIISRPDPRPIDPRPIDPRPRVSGPIALLSKLWLWPRKVWYRARLRKPSTARILDLTIEVSQNIMNPAVFRTGAYFAKSLPRLEIVKRQVARSTAPPLLLDMGTGSGLLALAGASLGYHATGVDISEEAIHCARANAVANGLSEQTRFSCGDLFAPVGEEKFDLILCSLPKFRGEPKSEFEISWRSPDVIDRFAAAVGNHLKPEGFALVLLTTHGDDKGMLDALEANGLQPQPVAQKHFGVEIFTIFKISLARDIAY